LAFVGPPPAIARPELFAALEKEHPNAQVFFRELAFPHGTTRAWLAGVDVAISHSPIPEDGVGVQPLREEPRTLVMHRGHPLARRQELAAADALDECFVSYHPDVQPGWAAFHSLDDCRGGPPRQQSADHALTPLEMLGIVSTSHAITSAPYEDARLAEVTLTQIAAVPLVGHRAGRDLVDLAHRHHNPLIGALTAAARSVESGDGA